MEILSSITKEASNILILFTTEKTGTIKCLPSVKNHTRMLAANSENKMAILTTQNYLTKQRENKRHFLPTQRS